MRAGVVDDDHGAVGQVANRLMRFTAFFHETEFNLVAGDNGGSQARGRW